MAGQVEVGLTLAEFLAGHSDKGVARIVEAIADASRQVSALVRRGTLGLDGATGDVERRLTEFANAALLEACRGAGVRALACERLEAPVVLAAEGAFLVAVDALDGISNIDANVAMGTVFSVLDAPAGEVEAGMFLQPGHRQRAAGFVIYGPQTALVFTTGSGTHMALLDPAADAYRVTRSGIAIPEGAAEFAINASNYRHWLPPVRTYFDDCIEGAEGPRGKNFNMRWVASLVADAYRIFTRGGVFLYPADTRRGYERGWLRLVYEANPIAMLVEQAGGAATDGVNRILDIVPKSTGDRIPLVFGSNDKVERVRRYHTSNEFSVEQSPLFGKRGLLRN